MESILSHSGTSKYSNTGLLMFFKAILVSKGTSCEKFSIVVCTAEAAARRWWAIIALPRSHFLPSRRARSAFPQ